MRLHIIGILTRILEIIIPLLLRVAFLVLAKHKVMASMQRRKGS
jgi:NADH:ubiquinone oxidoreductase subunit H